MNEQRDWTFQKKRTSKNCMFIEAPFSLREGPLWSALQHQRFSARRKVWGLVACETARNLRVRKGPSPENEGVRNWQTSPRLVPNIPTYGETRVLQHQWGPGRRRGRFSKLWWGFWYLNWLKVRFFFFFGIDLYGNYPFKVSYSNLNPSFQTVLEKSLNASISFFR